MALGLGLDSLPMELFLAVVANLGIPDQLVFGLCRRDYHDVIERDVFMVEPMRDLAMKHAIANLNIHLVERLLVRHKASPTVLYVINRSYNALRGFIATNAGILVLARFLNSRSVYPQQDSSETVVGIAEFTLHALTKLDTAKMDAEQRKTYIDMWRLFLHHGARLNILCCPQSTENLNTYLYKMYPSEKEAVDKERMACLADSAKFGRRKTRELFRRIMSKPSWTPDLADVKAQLIRMYYETLRGIAVADLDISPPRIFQQVARQIRSVHDTVVVEAILDGEEALDRAAPAPALAPAPAPAPVPGPPNACLPLPWRSIPVVDRPVQHGQRGGLVSPLSAAILNDNRAVFDLLLRRGANINGTELGYKRHGPNKYALHVPIFAAAWVAARDFTTGFRWIMLCLENGASPNLLCLGRLNGDFCIDAGFDVPGRRRRFFHWITPLDVYLATIPRKTLRQRVQTLNGARTADAESEPELRKVNELVRAGFCVDWTACQPIAYLLAPPLRDRPEPMAAAHVCGNTTDKDAYLCNWSGYHRCQSPSAAEIVIDRVGFGTITKASVALELVRLLMTRYCSGRSSFSRMLFRYEHDMQQLEYQLNCDCDADHSMPMAKFIYDCMASFGWNRRDLSNEFGLYLVYRVLHNRFASTSAYLAILKRFKAAADDPNSAAGAMFQLPAVPGLPAVPNLVRMDLNPLYSPLHPAYDGYRLLVCGYARDWYNAYPSEGWTVLHEVCRLWNLTSKAVSARLRIGQEQEILREYRDHASGVLKLLYFLIESGVNIYDIDANQETPMDVLIRDTEHGLPLTVAASLWGMAGFMETTHGCLNMGHEPMRAPHVDPPSVAGHDFNAVVTNL